MTQKAQFLSVLSFCLLLLYPYPLPATLSTVLSATSSCRMERGWSFCQADRDALSYSIMFSRRLDVWHCQKYYLVKNDKLNFSSPYQNRKLDGTDLFNFHKFSFFWTVNKRSYTALLLN